MFSTEGLIINVGTLMDIMNKTSEETSYNLSQELLPVTTATFNVTNNTTIGNVTNVTDVHTTEQLLLEKLGARSQDLVSTVLLLTIYGLIFISGTVGNICTCIVIIRNSYMQTTTNYYLFSLAVSDVFILFLALPQEAYSVWEAYPWRFGEVFCYIKAILWEMTSYASVLTITAFTVERYVAICHPLKAHKFANLSRSVKIIIAIWIIALACALPYPIHTELFYYIKINGTPVADSLVCNIPVGHLETMTYMFQLSTFLFFVFPMTVIIVLYIMIALTLRQAALQRVSSNESHNGFGQTLPSAQSRKAVLRMLVAVVVAFFLCWAPFHAQRLLTIYIHVWTPALHKVQSTLFYISGVLYFVSSTVNPILYNVMSKRYREAFKDTICTCRRKRTPFVRGSSFHQSYHYTKSNRESSRKYLNKGMSVDEQTTVFDDNMKCSISSAGDTDSAKDSARVQLLNEVNEIENASKACEHSLLSGDRNKNVYCKQCIERDDSKLTETDLIPNAVEGGDVHHENMPVKY